MKKGQRLLPPLSLSPYDAMSLYLVEAFDQIWLGVVRAIV
jgi:hypothetical protein